MGLAAKAGTETAASIATASAIEISFFIILSPYIYYALVYSAVKVRTSVCSPEAAFCHSASAMFTERS